MFHRGMSFSGRAARERGAHSSGPPGAATSLAELAAGRSARVLEIRGGTALEGRLAALGIVPGAVVVKKSAISAHGPIVVEKGAVKLALGYGMGQRILVVPEDGDTRHP